MCVCVYIDNSTIYIYILLYIICYRHCIKNNPYENWPQDITVCITVNTKIKESCISQTQRELEHLWSRIFGKEQV